MCGIVGAISKENITKILIQGLKRLEYRGYDSCGIAVQDPKTVKLKRMRGISRVEELAAQANQTIANTGIAHTRWATHGAPAIDNAHPHISTGKNNQNPAGNLTLVHNGIIENYETLKEELQKQGYQFTSQTDTEVIVHLIDSLYEQNQKNLLKTVQSAVTKLNGNYSIAVIHQNEPQTIIAARRGSPLVIGIGNQTNLIASDAIAIAGHADKVIYLKDGDTAKLSSEKIQIYDSQNSPVEREQTPLKQTSQAAELGPYQHYMQKEIFEQPKAVADTLEGIEKTSQINQNLYTNSAGQTPELSKTKHILILACGTSYYAGCVARYWIEEIAQTPCTVEIASEYRYRKSAAQEDTLVITISQSGETADTLSALKHSQSLGIKESLAICNAAQSALTRESKYTYLTRAGVEIGVASTKAFTTQLIGLFLFTLALAKAKNQINLDDEEKHLKALRHLPTALQATLALEPQIINWAGQFANKENALFLGRGAHYPIALEGALKLKEITYIHAEAYAAGELKHGPLALVTSAMPVITVAPNDALLEKLKSNMQEVRARGGVLYALADTDTKISPSEGLHVIKMPENYGILSPILHTIPLQLLAYHTALAKGTDVDKPRNLAKSVTVE